MDLQHQRPAIGVNHRMAFAPQHLPARTIAARAAGFRGVDALAVDHSGAWTCLTTGEFAIEHDEVMVD